MHKYTHTNNPISIKLTHLTPELNEWTTICYILDHTIYIYIVWTIWYYIVRLLMTYKQTYIFSSSESYIIKLMSVHVGFKRSNDCSLIENAGVWNISDTIFGCHLRSCIDACTVNERCYNSGITFWIAYKRWFHKRCVERFPIQTLAVRYRGHTMPLNGTLY